MNIAMWSGPRNLSTALMYAFGARADCAVVDEPFYAAFLDRTGLDHPMRAEILAAGQTDADKVARMCSGPPPGGKPHFYQKQMAHHMVPGIPRGWFGAVRHAFLIRHPVLMVASYLAKREAPTAEDLGYRALIGIYDRVRALGQTPPVVDSADIRRDPEGTLSALCAALGIAWDPAMLSWPAGGHPDDGVWAAHWYGAVHRSTGFDGPEGDLPVLPDAWQALADSQMAAYEALRDARISSVRSQG